VQNLAGDARSRGNGEQQSGTLLAHHRQDGASHIHRAEQERLDLIANLFRAELLEETGEEVARVVDQPVATTASPVAKAAVAMSTPKPRPASVMSHTLFSVMTCSAFGLRAIN
jgi:hypothetical protein